MVKIDMQTVQVEVTCSHCSCHGLRKGSYAACRFGAKLVARWQTGGRYVERCPVWSGTQKQGRESLLWLELRQIHLETCCLSYAELKRRFDKVKEVFLTPIVEGFW